MRTVCRVLTTINVIPFVGGRGQAQQHRTHSWLWMSWIDVGSRQSNWGQPCCQSKHRCCQAERVAEPWRGSGDQRADEHYTVLNGEWTTVWWGYFSFRSDKSHVNQASSVNHAQVREFSVSSFWSVTETMQLHEGHLLILGIVTPWHVLRGQKIKLRSP